MYSPFRAVSIKAKAILQFNFHVMWVFRKALVASIPSMVQNACCCYKLAYKRQCRNAPKSSKWSLTGVFDIVTFLVLALMKKLRYWRSSSIWGYSIYIVKDFITLLIFINCISYIYSFIIDKKWHFLFLFHALKLCHRNNMHGHWEFYAHFRHISPCLPKTLLSILLSCCCSLNGNMLVW